MFRFNLKTTLVVDAVTCIGLFLLGVFATDTIAEILGLPVWIVAVAGWIGLPSASLMLFAAMQKPPSRHLANLIAIGNLGWVVASVAVLMAFSSQMTGVGIILVVIQALIVLDLAILEAKGAASLPKPVAVY